MDPSDVIYLSDAESPFDLNQQLIKEHQEEEDRRRVQNHLTRVLEEVKEGKQKTMRIAAHSEPSNIPIAIPLGPSLSVTIAFEPGDFQFNIMSQESQTGSLFAAPVVVAESMPFGALLYQSTITDITEISAVLKKHVLKISSNLSFRVLVSHERSYHAPRGTNKLQYSACSQEHLKTGALFPLKSYFTNYLNYV